MTYTMLYSTPQTTRFSSAGSQRTFLQRAPTRRSITPSRIHAPIYASSAEITNSATVQDAVSVLQAAAASSKVAPTQVFQALRDLEKAKVPTEGWNEVLGGTESPGRRWRLVFTSGTKEVQAALKGAGQGSGKYFPLTAVQRWDAKAGKIENGIFLGFLAALTFSGPYVMKGKKLSFDFDTVQIKLGPGKFSIPLKTKIDPSTYVGSPKDPFFLFFYVDDNVVAARGRGGGVAFWARTTPQWELEKGVA